MRYSLGVLTTHPIQYYSAWFRHLAGRLDLQVFYAHRQDARGQAEAGFGVDFKWDTPLLEGYRYRWLVNVSANPRVGTFRGCDTPEITEFISSRRLDSWLIFGWNYKSALQAVWACRRSGVPVLMRGDSQLPAGRALWKRILKFFPYRLGLPRVDAHLYVGKRNREYLEHYGVPTERLFFCPHCVDNQFFARRANQAERCGENWRIRQELGIGRRDFVALFAGKLIPVKRPADMIEAFVRIEQRTDAGLWLIVVGSGPLESELRRRAAESSRVRFLGFQNQSRMPALYRTADVLLMPSESETWGLAVNEAMAAGLPAIVSDGVGCSPDLIVEGSTGLTYPTGDIEALVDCLLRMRQLTADRGCRIRRSVSKKIEEYSMDRATLGLLQALSAVAGREGRR